MNLPLDCEFLEMIWPSFDEVDFRCIKLFQQDVILHVAMKTISLFDEDDPA
jgi:hypothetical protein